ncbi:hypothetical protein Vadar_017323 [Vaccinium darrowii]|uniref:Uncharacterized protein n=1 Tax=Vaccinium darrowii TaxID=229202 RepID=A0ACB7YYD8_9ERIC|nr:hypothetical protein Vadar_017323 [Vaccinium darrowii]
MGSWRNHVFLSHILIHLVGLIISQPDFVFKDCGLGFGNYTTNSMYQTNLDTLLSSLSSNIDSYGFYNSSSGENADKVNAIELCRGDVDLDTCRGCINNATSKITQDCPNSKEASGWYDLCILRYSNESIDGKVKNSPPHCAGNTFNEALRTLLNRLSSQASSGTLRKFATGNETGPGNQTIYGAMQCTPDLSEQDCSFCLQTIMTDIPSCIADSEGWRVDVPSCNLRFDNVPFFSQIPADSPPGIS